MKLFLNLIVIELLILLSPALFAQEAAMDFVNYPNSISLMGMGQNSVASNKSDGALINNPANLIYTNQPTISFYHRQFAIYGIQLPIDNISVRYNLKGIGAFGIEYTNHGQGDFIITSPSGPEPIGKYSRYQRSFTLGFARSFTDDFTAGIQLRYAKINYGYVSAEHFFLSAGLNYSPTYFEKEFTLGFSLTNLSTPIKYEMPDITYSTVLQPSPSKVNLGLLYVPINNNYFSLGLQAAASKDLVYREIGKIGDSTFVKDAKSSFSALFSDWEDFPKDVDLHFGLAYEWKPLDLGNGFSFFQEFYVGNMSRGSKNNSSGFLTHGANYGILYKGFKLTAGYTGIWHLVHNISYISSFAHFPMESFQFTLGINDDLIFGRSQVSSSSAQLKKIVVSAGIGQSFRLGRYKEVGGMWYSIKHPDNLNYFLEAAFYFNERNSLISSFSYSPVPYEVTYGSYKYIDTELETINFSSQYRYHPFDFFLPFYIQGGLGIVRYKPNLDNVSVRYEYKTTIHLAIGSLLDYFNPIVITPEIAFTNMLNTAGSTAPRLGGFNQFDLVLKLGYRI